MNFKEPAQTLKSDDVDAAAIAAGGSVKLAAALKLLVLSCLPSLTLGLNNGAALKPPLGWQNWNGFGMRFNASLFKDMADAMAKNGLLAAGYTLISASGSTYPHQGLAPHWNSTNNSNIRNVITRNSSGFYTIDPARFPGPHDAAPGAAPDAAPDADPAARADISCLSCRAGLER